MFFIFKGRPLLRSAFGMFRCSLKTGTATRGTQSLWNPVRGLGKLLSQNMIYHINYIIEYTNVNFNEIFNLIYVLFSFLLLTYVDVYAIIR